jgi:hypothetical protein
MSGVDVRQDLTLAPVNKVHHVHTIARVVEMLEENEDWLCDVATEMDQEDGLIWVYGPGETSVMAFTDFGIQDRADLRLAQMACCAFGCNSSTMDSQRSGPRRESARRSEIAA